jgi:hypothetical protein
MHARVALRERSLLDIVDLTVRFFATNARAYARLALVVLIPVFLMSLGLAHVGGWAWAWFGTLAVATLVEAPFTSLASRLVFEEKVRVRDAVVAAARALPSLIGARILQILAIGMAAMLVLFPVFWASAVLSFVVEVIVLERSGTMAAFGRSSRIANTQLGEAVAATLLLAVLPVASVLLCDIAGREMLEGIFEVRPPPPVWHSGGGWLALLGFWAAAPIVATARFFVYLNFRTRSEGWDIQTRFAAIAVRAAQDGRAMPRGAQA